MEKQEIWMDIKGYEGLYLISDQGRVYSIRNNLYMAYKETQDGYLQVRLSWQGKKKTEYIHRLVARHFIPNPDNLPQVNHKDENPQNNNVSNLEWVTAKTNNNYGKHNERAAKARCKPVRCIELDKVYESAKAAQDDLGIFASQITAVCRGKGLTAGGYHWERI